MPTLEGPRPATERTAIGMLGVVGTTAAAGGVELLLYPHGNAYVEPEWLEDLPVADYRLPGLLLSGVVGGSSLVAAYGLVRRPRWRWLAPLERRTGRHWSWTATGLAGVGLAVWIGVEVALLPERSPIEALYAALAGGLIALPLTRSFRRSLDLQEPSDRTRAEAGRAEPALPTDRPAH